MPVAHSARIVSIAVSSRSSRSAGGGNGSPNARCSRSHQPAPTPQNARPPESASRVATALAVIPGGRKVTGRDQRAEPQPGVEAGEQAERGVATVFVALPDLEQPEDLLDVAAMLP